GGTFACGGSLSFTKDGKRISIQNEGSANLMEDLQALIESCSVDSSKEAASEQKWKEMAASPRMLHYTLPQGFAFALKLQGGIQTEVQEVILPLPKESFPDHLYIKNRNGYHSYTKYSPFILRKIVASPAIGLISEPRYRSLPET